MRSPFALSLRPILTALFFTCALASAREAAAAWPNDVTQGVMIGGWTGWASDKVVICPDNQGGFWAGSITWYFSTGYYEIRHVSATGATLASIFSPASGYSKSELQLVPDGSNGVIVVWVENGNILSRRYSSTGGLPWGASPVSLCSHAATQNSLSAALDSYGNVLVFWTDYRNGDADVYMQAINISSGAAQAAANGVAVVALAGSAQYSPRACSDGNLGAYVVWQDTRNNATTGIDLYMTRVDYTGVPYYAPVPLGNVVGSPSNARLIGNPASLQVVWEEDRGAGTGSDIYFQRIPSSSPSALFGTGLVVCNAAAGQSRPALVADGQGGAIIVWDDARTSVTTGTDIYAQRVGAGGLMQWTANGISLCTAPDAQTDAQVVSDQAGGAIVSWSDNRTGFLDAYARRVLSTGSVNWASNGVPVCSGDMSQGPTALLSDGNGGAFVAFGDDRTLITIGASSVLAQRIDRFGMIGSPEPTIAKVKDVPNDQGGLVRVSWNASYMDALPNNKVDEYWVWREAPVFAMQAGARALPAASGRTEPMRRAVPSASGVIYWERIAVVPATALAGYSVVAATTSDSIGGSNPRTRFQVEAHQFSTEYFWASAPDSGYSVDNLGPAAPSPQYAIYSGGSTRLGWLPNHEADLMGYEVHRGSSASFTPSPATFVTSQPDTGLVDVAGAPYFYKLVAVDVHGNRSPVATLAPTGTLDAPGGVVAHAFFAAPSPNPVRGGTTLRFGLARGGAAKLAIYDAAGRLVRTLHAGTLAAGEHAMRWDARGDGGGDVAPGLYLARLETPGAAAMVRRIVVTQ